jgi:sister chromatid cohesion protein DCC1
MSEYDLSFSPLSSEEYGSYKLVELTPDLTTSIEDANEDFRSDI